MSEERKQILDMLAARKITADEAAQLLDRLTAERPAPPRDDEPLRTQTEPAVAKASRSALPKYLRVLVDSTDGDRVNIRVPLELVRTGIRLGAMMPEHARAKLEDRGIDLSQLSGLQGEELMQALRELTVDVDSADGDTVRIFCE